MTMTTQETDIVAARFTYTEPRYLTDDAKADYLAYWHEQIAKGRFTEPGEGGHGYPDREMVEWCAKINAIDGVCTTQSCAGHRNAEDHLYCGEVWLHLSQPMANAFRARAFELWDRHDLIESVFSLYGAWGAEIAAIQFKGLEHECLDEAMAFILAFLQSLAAGATRLQHSPITHAKVAEAIRDVRNLCQFAYEQGYHEMGYDPVQVLVDAIVLIEPTRAK